MKTNVVIAMFLSAMILVPESSCWATGLFTPAEPGTKDLPGFQRKKYEREEPYGMTFGLGAYSSKMDFKDLDSKVEQNHLYVHLGKYWEPDFETYVNIGAADMNVDDDESTYSAFLSVGGSLTLFNSGFFSFGPMVQYTKYGNHTLKEGDVSLAKVTGLWDLNAGMYLAVVPTQWLKAQVVPFVYFSRGTVEFPSGNEADLKEKNNFGGAVTLRFYPAFKLTEAVSIDLEGQYKAGFSYGAAVNFSF